MATNGRRYWVLVATTVLVSTFPALVWAQALRTEVYSPRLIRVGPPGRAQLVPDLCVSGQCLVTLEPTVTPAQFQAALARQGGRVLQAFPRLRMFLVSLPQGTAVSQGVARWRGEPGVANAGPNGLKYPMAPPNDPLYAQQYQWPRIAAPDAWDLQTGSPQTVVAIIDTGIQLNHEDMQAKIWQNAGEIPGNGVDDDGNGFVDDTVGWDFLDNDNDPAPHPTTGQFGASHGTHVGGLVGAATNNGIGVAGQDWACKLMVLRVFPEDGGTTDAVILAAMDYALLMGADVINMSLGGGYTAVYDTPMQAARAQGCVVVVAAGNDDWMFTDDPSSWWSPVCNDGPNPTVDNWVLGVAATDADDHKAWFSNYDGSSTKTFVDVSAPGMDVLSCLIFDPANGFNTPYGTMSGTSMACPIVAGLCALLHAQYPSYAPLDIINQIRTTADNIDALNPGYEGMLGTGRINDLAAISLALPPGPPRRVSAMDTPGDEGGSITVTWAKSLDDGRGRNSVKDYLVQKCGNQENEYGVDQPDGNWQDLAVLPKGSTSYVDAPVPDYTPYWYRVGARDNLGNVSFSNPAGPAEARDDLPPPAVWPYLSAADTPSDEGGSITLDWSGYTPPSDFQTYRVYRSTSSFTSVTQAQLIYPTPGDPDLTDTSYQDNTAVDGTNYYYAVTAVDDVGNELKTVTAVGPVTSQPNFVLSLPSGVSMFSIGVQTTQDDVATLLGISPSDMKLAVWSPAIGDYIKSWVTPGDPALKHRLGRAFFIRLLSPLLVEIGGQPAKTDFDVAVQVGWNMVGNPFLHDFRWDGVTVRTATRTYTLVEANSAGVMRDFAWYWDAPSGSYRLVSARPDVGEKIIRQSRGFWVLAFQPCTVRLPAALPTSAPLPTAAGSSQVDWKMRLVARCGEFADVDNFIGVSASPADLNAIVSPPSLGQGVELFFVNAGVDGPAAASFVGPGAKQLWTARVAVAGLAGREVEISWPDLSSVPSSVRPLLVDKTSGKRVYMRTAAFYRFTPEEGESFREFEITAVGSGTLQIAAVAARPAGGGVEVVFNLSAPAEVSAEVLNLAGRVVARLRPGAMSAGPCSLRWNGLNASGARVPAGLYLIRLRAQAADGQETNVITQARLAP